MRSHQPIQHLLRTAAVLALLVPLLAIACSGKDPASTTYEPDLNWQQYHWKGLVAGCAAPSTVELYPDRVILNCWIESEIELGAIGLAEGAWEDSVTGRSYPWRLEFVQYDRVMEGDVVWRTVDGEERYRFIARAVNRLNP